MFVYWNFPLRFMIMSPRFLSIVFTSAGPVWKLRRDQFIDVHGGIFIWCLLRQRNGVLISGLKSTTIITDSLFILLSISTLLFTFRVILMWFVHLKVIRSFFFFLIGNRHCIRRHRPVIIHTFVFLDGQHKSCKSYKYLQFNHLFYSAYINYIWCFNVHTRTFAGFDLST